MARELYPVRFKLSELLAAVRRTLNIEAAPNTQEALKFYMEWATSRGWSLVAAANQLDPGSLVTRLERTAQVELVSEEFWNVIWEGDDTTGSPDIIAYAAEPTDEAESVAYEVELEFRKGGWVHGYATEGDVLFRAGFCPVPFIDILNLANEGKTADEIIKALVRDKEPSQ